MQRGTLAALACALVVPVALPAAAPAKPAKKDPSVALQQAVTVQGMLRHERALANIAERNGGTRASGTPGFAKSRDYVVARLKDAGYDVDRPALRLPVLPAERPRDARAYGRRGRRRTPKARATTSTS